MNYLRSGMDDIGDFVTADQIQYLQSWVALLKAVGGIFYELGNSILLPVERARGELPAEARDFLVDLLFSFLGPTYREPFPKAGRPRMKWAFAPDKRSIARLFGSYDAFAPARLSSPMAG
jgi:hypothetical protein